jgi:collagen triple helix repeat protein
MPPAANGIASRQHTEALWKTVSQIPVGQIFQGDVRQIGGYANIAFLAISNQPIVLDIEEANDPSGPFLLVASFAAEVDSRGQYVIREQYQPGALFARALVQNSDPNAGAVFDLCAYGLAHGGGGGSGGSGGIQGSQGPQGTNPGIQGPQGLVGATGSGFQGPIGATGFQGNIGSLGPQGNIGSGFQGFIGPQGSEGPQGLQGNQGNQGLAGVGVQGSQGLQGFQGAQGLVGLQGFQGAQGNQGFQGLQGAPDGSLPANATVHSLYTETVISDTTPITPAMTYDGAAVSSVPVPAGQSLVITELYIGIGFLYWTLEVDRGLGAGFVTLATFGFTLAEIAVSEKIEFKSPIVVPGGTGVQIRFTVAAAVTPSVPLDACLTARCYTLAGSPGPTLPANRASTIITLTDLTTTGITEEVLNISEDAGTPGLTVPVPAATVLQITDYQIAGGGQRATFRLQQTNDGVAWFNIAALQVAGVAAALSVMTSPKTSWRVDGGANVAVRIAVMTPDGPTPVAANLSGYRYS